MRRTKRIITAVGFGAVVSISALILLASSHPTPRLNTDIEQTRMAARASRVIRSAIPSAALSITDNATHTVSPSVLPSQAPQIAATEVPVLPENPVSNQIILQFAPETSEAEREAYIRSIGGTIQQSIPGLNTAVVQLPETLQPQSAFDSPILAATEPDYYVTALFDVPPSDPHFSQQWALPVIGAPSSWSALPDPALDITVAVIDSGICASHPDLQGRILPGYDFVEDDTTPQDELGHGCGVAGVIAANIDNDMGISGVAPNAQILPLRVLDRQGIGTYSDVAAAIVKATDKGARIINLSVGGVNPSSLLQNAVDYAVERDVLVIAAAGNTSSSVLYPAAYSPVVAVGSVDSDLQMSSFSSRGPEIDLLAPGRDILVTSTDGGYMLASGSSFAAPHVAGVAALEMALGRSLNLNGGIVTVGGIQPPQILTTSTPLPTEAARPAVELFLDTDALAATGLTNQRGIIRSRNVEINFAAIPQAGAAAAQSVEAVTFNLFEDTTLVAEQERTEPSSVNDDGYVWVGQLKDTEYSTAILVVGDGQVEGFIETLDGRYQITYAGNGVHTVSQIDSSAFSVGPNDAIPVGLPSQFPPESDVSEAATNLHIIDILVAYTANARIRQGGTSAIQNAIQLAVVDTNQSLINSDANLRVRLAGTMEVSYTEAVTLDIDLYRLTDPFDGFMDSVHTMRNVVNADLVALITDEATNACGVGWLGNGNPDYGFSVSALDCLTPSHTFAHEIGHNLGAHHDKANANGQGAYSYSYGYRDPQGRFRDVMSYEAGCGYPCSSINYYSNTTRTLGDRPIGSAQANNARTFNNTAPVVAKYRNGPFVSATATPTPLPPVIGTPTATPLPPELPACTVNIAAGSTSELISAINTANSNGPGTDVICLSAGSVYTFSSGPFTNGFDGGNALPIITSNITILGNGATLTRSGNSHFRFFFITSGAAVWLDNITLNNGRCAAGDCYEGGAIFHYFGQLTITNSTLSGNVSGLWGGAISGYDNITIVSSSFSGNAARFGGGIDLYGFASSLSISRTLFAENTAQLGGAISIAGEVDAAIESSCFIRNANVSIDNDTNPASTINAVYNWWGATYGPSLNNGAFQGVSDIIETTGISYIPFLQARPVYCAPIPKAIGPTGSTTTNPPTFSWNKTADAISYEIQYGDTNPPTITATTSATSYKPPQSLLNKVYYWQVRAQFSDGSFSGWSPIQTVTIASAANAAPVRNYYDTATPLLTWSPITSALEYEIQVATSTKFSAPLSFTAVVPADTQSINTTALADGIYYWRVRARNSANKWGAWSAAESFAVDAP